MEMNKCIAGNVSRVKARHAAVESVLLISCLCLLALQARLIVIRQSVSRSIGGLVFSSST